MAMRCDSLKAMAHGWLRAAVAINTSFRAKFGRVIAISRAWNPPIELPTTA